MLQIVHEEFSTERTQQRASHLTVITTRQATLELANGAVSKAEVDGSIQLGVTVVHSLDLAFPLKYFEPRCAQVLSWK